MLTTAAGDPLIELITLAYQADLPVLVHGRHGVGKSEILAQATSRLRIDCVICDLSVMEPPDLIGIPRTGEDGRTHYALPAFLPTEGRGLLVFEELNRCLRYMQAPCLQLLTARQLNDYTLPPGWLPCAAVNDVADGYLVDELDAALLSRFLHVKVMPDVTEWLRWAAQHQVHHRIIEFVEASPGIFDDPVANPRAWVHASKLLSVWEHGDRSQAMLALALSGVLNDRWALAFIQVYSDVRQPLRPEEIIEAYPAHQAAVRGWIGRGQLDVVAASLELLKRHLQAQRSYDAVIREPAWKANVEAFLVDLPADLQRQAREWLDERGFRDLAAPSRSRRTRP